MITNTKSRYIVIIEWDGAEASNTYYRRRHGLALKVRGEGAKQQMEDMLDHVNPAGIGDTFQAGEGWEIEGVLARRKGDAEKETGVIFQEGAVLCPSEDLARAVYWLTVKEIEDMEADGRLEDDQGFQVRFPMVELGRASTTDRVTMSRKDTAILERIEDVLGKRGRKPDPEAWAVSCRECNQVNQVETWRPLNCPNCGSLGISSRRGEAVPFKDPGGDVVEAWKATRFAFIHWEPTAITEDGQDAPPFDGASVEREAAALELLDKSPDLDLIRTMPRPVAFDFLDAMLTGRAYKGQETRLRLRAETATEWMISGGDALAINIMEPAEALDLIDAAHIIKKDAIIAWLDQKDQDAE